MSRIKLGSLTAILFMGLALLFAGQPAALAQSTATFQGAVLDAQGAVIAGAKITVKNLATNLEREAESDVTGNFSIPALPAGNYRVEIRKDGFQLSVIPSYTLAVGSTTAQNFALTVGQVTQTVEVSSEAPLVESSTMSVGEVISQKTVQEIPLNGRHFVDLGLLIPGSVTPPQNGFLTAPLRGQGSFAFNTAGNREDTVNFMVNGINLNDMVQNQITFQPSINTVSEFKVDNSTYSAEYGRNSGAIVNIATRSGSNNFHGEAFEFLRNHVMDARNFFNPITLSSGAFSPQAPLKRNQFGGAIGGPVFKDRTFFFFSYEGLRQRQGLSLTSGVLSDSNFLRAGVDERTLITNTSDPAVVKLLALIPAPNSASASGAPIFIGSAVAPVNIDQWTIDISHTLSKDDRLHGYYAFQRDLRQEPVIQGDTIPGFGDTRQSRRQIMTLNETHIFNSTMVNEARLGFNRIHITFVPNAQLNPMDFSISDGISTAIGIPQITITSIGLTFGGPAGMPSGRGDTTAAFSDTLSWQKGRHSFKFGGEVRRFYNNNFNLDTGSFSFGTPTTLSTDTFNSFAINLSNGASRIVQPAWGLFAMDTYKLRPNLTLELGVRYDWNSSPSEAMNRFVIFDPASLSLNQVGAPGFDKVYATNKKNVEPRIGFSWDPFNDGKTSVRGGYSIQTDQPVTNTVTGLTTNPPFGDPLSALSGSLMTALSVAKGPGGISPAYINPNFKNPYVQSWNLNFQRAVTGSLGITAGYFGSKGTHLRIAENINQKINGAARPYSALVSSSTYTCPVFPALTCPALSNITQVSSDSNSSYNALWVSASQRLHRNLQFNASYAYSHSIDENSLSTQGIVVQDSTNLRNDRGSSDFDVRHRFVISWIYELPFKGHRWNEGWQMSAISQWQTGNPINILISSNAFTGVASMRPDLLAPVQIIGDPSQWFSNTVCSTSPCASGTATFGLPATLPNVINHFGDLGRNAVTGPGFSNTDFSVIKNTKVNERLKVQFRAEFFDVFNHPNFGQPGRVASVGSSSFGVITNTRFPTGDFGSARQIQFALKLLF
jgi:hypothetical protein